MDPITGAAIAGGVLGFKGQKAAGKAAAQAAEYNAQVAENEAILLARQKREEERMLRMQGRQLTGAQMVASAKSGVQVSGSVLDAMADSFFAVERDIANVRYASNIQQVKAGSDIAMTRLGGQIAQKTANVQAFSTLLGSTTTAGVNYDKMTGGSLARRFYG